MDGAKTLARTDKALSGSGVGMMLGVPLKYGANRIKERNYVRGRRTRKQKTLYLIADYLIHNSNKDGSPKG